jgi:hypothetical protein
MCRNAKKTSRACTAVKVSAVATQGKRTTSGTVAVGTVQRRKRQTHNEIRSEGYDCALRNCAEALLNEGNSREYVADIFGGFRDMPFPSTDDTTWDVSWAFDDWDDWVAAEETECEDEVV